MLKPIPHVGFNYRQKKISDLPLDIYCTELACVTVVVGKAHWMSRLDLLDTSRSSCLLSCLSAEHLNLPYFKSTDYGFNPNLLNTFMQHLN
jgi:hypothetical protein